MLEVTILGFKPIEVNGDKFMVYTISTVDPAGTHKVLRRYSDFKEFHTKQIATEDVFDKRPALTGKMIFGNFDDANVEKRRVKLETYIKEQVALASKDPAGCLFIHQLRDFLGLPFAKLTSCVWSEIPENKQLREASLSVTVDTTKPHAIIERSGEVTTITVQSFEQALEQVQNNDTIRLSPGVHPVGIHITKQSVAFTVCPFEAASSESPAIVQLEQRMGFLSCSVTFKNITFRTSPHTRDIKTRDMHELRFYAEDASASASSSSSASAVASSSRSILFESCIFENIAISLAQAGNVRVDSCTFRSDFLDVFVNVVRSPKPQNSVHIVGCRFGRPASASGKPIHIVEQADSQVIQENNVFD